MEQRFEDLNIIDLISEKHIILRRAVEERWSASQEEEITHTEGLLLAKISMDKLSLAEVARQANVSRQAMFKCAKKLEEKGYLRFVKDEDGAKYTELTEQGRKYCEKSSQLKEELEREIAEKIGEEAVESLKELLKRNWIEKKTL